jgi:hypothetical protein
VCVSERVKDIVGTLEKEREGKSVWCVCVCVLERKKPKQKHVGAKIVL